VEKGAPTRRNVALNSSFLPHNGATRTEHINYHPMQKRGVASKRRFFRRRREEARQVEKEKEQMRLSGYTCSL